MCDAAWPYAVAGSARIASEPAKSDYSHDQAQAAAYISASFAPSARGCGAEGRPGCHQTPAAIEQVGCDCTPPPSCR